MRSDAPAVSPFLPCAAALASLFVFAVSANTLPAVLIRAAADFRIRPETLAYATTAQFLGFFLATALGGVVSDFVGKKPVFLVACGLTMAGATGWATATSLAGACIGGFFMGTGGGVLEGMSSALLADLFPRRRRFFLNLSQAVYCAGACSGPFLAGLLLPRGVPWRAFFAGTAAMAAALLLLYAASSLPRPPQAEGWKLSDVVRTARQFSLLIPCATIFLYVLSETCVVVYVNLYLRRHCGAPESWAIYGLSLFWLTMIAGRLAAAFVPEDMNHRRLIAALLLGTACPLVLLRYASCWQASLGLFCLTGLMMAGGWPLIVALVASDFPHCTGTAVGIVVAIGSLGCVVCPPFMGALMSTVQSRNVFAAAALPCILGALLVLLPHSQPGRDAAQVLS